MLCGVKRGNIQKRVFSTLAIFLRGPRFSLLITQQHNVYQEMLHVQKKVKLIRCFQFVEYVEYLPWLKRVSFANTERSAIAFLSAALIVVLSHSTGYSLFCNFALNNHQKWPQSPTTWRSKFSRSINSLLSAPPLICSRIFASSQKEGLISRAAQMLKCRFCFVERIPS